ncbi:male accessory gland serine protease inhibitor-like [Anastrepha ludens]|uniref:male accessory gland serine protease inhibitor-like n=1 Tax=Anastrepha ludens TaxID=28586 RepID=UPI0023B1B4D7|nr:male accessory gland serine protease inhibitor-like [Anastrepha ludens]XP_053960863.1 male accessory gland serine protease inhibitor-like [Anastrepha ludens]
MKFLAYFLILAACVFLDQTAAQCPNQPPRTVCGGLPHSGVGGRGCIPGTRWWYNPATRNCASFHYFGCGGNANRYCSLADCRQRCVPRG